MTTSEKNMNFHAGLVLVWMLDQHSHTDQQQKTYGQPTVFLVKLVDKGDLAG